MVERDDEVFEALRRARPDDLPEEVASPQAPAAQALLERILSMQSTTNPAPGRDATPEAPAPTGLRRRDRQRHGRRGHRSRVVLIGAAAGVVAAVLATTALQGGTPAGDGGDGQASRTLDPSVMLPETLVSSSSEATGLEQCHGGHADLVEPDAVDEGLRLAPTWLPEGFEVDQTWARHQTQACPDADPLLFLRSVGEDGTVEAAIQVQGPYADPLPRYEGPDWTETTIRGEPGALMTLTGHPENTLVALTWTEGGASWWVEGSGVAPEALLEVAEALDLDTAAGPDEPLASLPADAVPAGFETTWQAQGTPALEDESSWWHVSLADTTQGQPEDCTVSLYTTTLDRPVAAGGPAGATLHTVRGHEAVAIPQGGTMLLWDEAPGIIGEVACPTDTATAIRIAESLAPVEG